MKFLIGLILFISSQSFAQGQAANTAPKTDSSSRNHNFEDLLVQGKYHFATDSVTTVEADKVFDTLIGGSWKRTWFYKITTEMC